MKKNIHNIEELVTGEVMRRSMPYEWLSKITSNEFKKWEKACREILLVSDIAEDKIDLAVREEIEKKEKLYQLVKEKHRLETKLQATNMNGRVYPVNTFHIDASDLVPDPSNPDAVFQITASTKTFK